MRRRTQDDEAFRALFAPIREAQPPARSEAAIRQAHTAITGRATWRTPLRLASSAAASWRRPRSTPR